MPSNNDKRISDALQKPIDLATSRTKIDDIDTQIIKLFCERMEIVRDVAAYKRATGKAVFDAEREQAKIVAAQEITPHPYKEYIAPLFTMLMELSRSYQDAHLYPENVLKSHLETLKFASDIPKV